MFLDATPVIYISLHHVRRKTVYIFIVYIYNYIIHSFLEHCVLQKISNTLYKCISTAKKLRCRCITQEIWLRIIDVVAGGNRNTLCINKLIHVASSNTLWEVKVP